MDTKIHDLLLQNGFDFMDYWQDETTGNIKQNYRKGNEDITIEYIINKDNL